jgi:hypothetical protein
MKQGELRQEEGVRMEGWGVGGDGRTRMRWDGREYQRRVAGIWIDSPATRKFIKITMEQFLSLAEYTFSRDITTLSVAGTLIQATGTAPLVT